MPAAQPDILLIGGGVIGLTTALRLADCGVSVTVVDRQRVGQEASWAGAGMLPPGLPQQQSPHDTLPESQERFLRCQSNSIWPDLAARLLDQTGIDNGYRRSGALEVAESAAVLETQRNAWRDEGITAEHFQTPEQIEQCVPGINTQFTQATWLPDFCQVRNPRHLKALQAACRMSGVEIVEDVSDLILTQSNLQISASGSNRCFSAERICITAGAWTASLLERLGISIPVRPVRGQMVQLRLPQLPFRCVIEHGSRYLVPRPDGLILVGSTEEHVGFEKQNTSEGVRGLLDFAASIVPELAQAEVVRQWAGLRPGSPAGLPYIGRLPQFENLYLAAGHFRSGLQMSPATAERLANLLTGPVPEPMAVETDNWRQEI